MVLLTVPHSGTRFTMEFFQYLGFASWHPTIDKSDKTVYFQQHTGPHSHREDGMSIDNNKVIVTVTHPYRCFISFLGRPNKPFELLVECWDELLDTLGDIDYYIFDINCHEFDRFNQLYGIVKHVGLESDELMKLTREFADEWRVVHAQDSKFKTAYLKDGTMPEGYNYAELDRAVRWYENLPTNSY